MKTKGRPLLKTTVLHRKLRELTQLIEQIQWVCPTYNGSDSCSGCGSQRHLGCEKGCPVAAITKDRGRE